MALRQARKQFPLRSRYLQVHQDGQRKAHVPSCRKPSGIIALLGSRAALRRNDCRARRQKLRANIHRAVQEPAGIVAQIDAALRPLFLQSVSALEKSWAVGSLNCTSRT